MPTAASTPAPLGCVPWRARWSDFTRYFYPTPILLSVFDGRDRLSILMNDYNQSPPQILVDWNNSLFGEGVSIKYLNDKFSKDYALIESNSFYSIYQLNIAK
jgi:hypothetical protein